MWLGGRDSNPDTQIQSPLHTLPLQHHQQDTSADHGQIRQTPQQTRNEDCFDLEDETLP
jgi:hypothetical protein